MRACAAYRSAIRRQAGTYRMAQHRDVREASLRSPPNICEKARRFMSREVCALASGRTRKVRTATRPKSSPATCRCSVAEVAPGPAAAASAVAKVGPRAPRRALSRIAVRHPAGMTAVASTTIFRSRFPCNLDCSFTEKAGGIPFLPFLLVARFCGCLLAHACNDFEERLGSAHFQGRHSERGKETGTTALAGPAT